MPHLSRGNHTLEAPTLWEGHCFSFIRFSAAALVVAPSTPELLEGQNGWGRRRASLPLLWYSGVTGGFHSAGGLSGMKHCGGAAAGAQAGSSSLRAPTQAAAGLRRQGQPPSQLTQDALPGQAGPASSLSATDEAQGS